MAKNSSKKFPQHNWNILPPWPAATDIAKQCRIPTLIAQLLYNRGIATPDQITNFLNPSLTQLTEPDQLQNITAAAARIRTAVNNNEKITIYGDYDVDGITASAILWHCLKLIGHQPDFYVPHRVDEGYGLNDDAICSIAEKGTNLIISVDCGITGHASAQLAADLGMDIIITDHHQLPDSLPPALAIIHPELTLNDTPPQPLCGAAVAFKLAWSLAQEFSGAKKVSSEFREFLVAATALVALGTIADVVPLIGENRILAQFGLQALKNTTLTGLNALISAARLDNGSISAADIGFRLAPRLNAAGRMGHARLAVELLTKSSSDRAEDIAKYLEGLNSQRQRVEKKITEQALEQIKLAKWDSPACRTIVVNGENWHAGVIGIVASRIIDKHYRPTIVIATDGQKAAGSCRSIKGFDITAALNACSQFLTDFGGHTMAAGLTLPLENIEPFRQAINEYALTHLTEADLIPSIDIDAEIELSDLDLPTVKLIESLSPFGQSNPPVTLTARNCRLVKPPQRMGKSNDHLQFLTTQPSSNPNIPPHQQPAYRTVAFGKAHWEKKLIACNSFDLTFEPVINRFNGNESVELHAKDIQFNTAW